MSDTLRFRFPHVSARVIMFEKLVEMGVRQISAGVRHPQTNGKLEWLHEKIQHKLPVRGNHDADRRADRPVHGMVQP